MANILGAQVERITGVYLNIFYLTISVEWAEFNTGTVRQRLLAAHDYFYTDHLHHVWDSMEAQKFIGMKTTCANLCFDLGQLEGT